jgi:glucosamine--fructose-6-phosphate aminotransferase (isomerizing)
MCGIMGYVGQRQAGPILLEGLQRLEYRGYDSAGIALLEENGGLTIRKRQGKLGVLATMIAESCPRGTAGIGHTRWATHGQPSDINAHPHTDCKGDIAVIHNGIVENHLALKLRLTSQGHAFASDTDTEVIVHLVEEHLADGCSLVEALRRAIQEMQGAHAIVVVSRREPGKLVAARVGNAGGIVVGYGSGETLVASDLPALLPHTRQVGFLGDRETAEVTADGARFYGSDAQPLDRERLSIPYDPISAAKGHYKHFMLKEMMEQPEAILDTIRSYVQLDRGLIQLAEMRLSRRQLRSVRRVLLVGMGSSLHAAMVGRDYIERIAGLPAEVDNASEFRYRQAILGPETLVIAVGQSGETVDTLAAMDLVKERGARLFTVCNVMGSQATRLADGVVYTRCGLEIGVCSSKTFTASIIALYLLACYLAQERGIIDREVMGGLLDPLTRLPNLLGEITARTAAYEGLAREFWRFNSFLYLGRGLQFPVALEGALKLKELSYIHAEGYPAGEMKHGPIALIDQDMPVVAIAVHDGLYDKMMNNIEEVKARGGTVIALGNEGDEELRQKADHVVQLPACSSLLMPVPMALPLQFFAYHIAVQRGCDVDQPRNLAKTVTVE